MSELNEKQDFSIVAPKTTSEQLRLAEKKARELRKKLKQEAELKKLPEYKELVAKIKIYENKIADYENQIKELESKIKPTFVQLGDEDKEATWERP